jgi:hypothetical protein
MLLEFFNAVDDNVYSTECTDDSNLLTGKVSDHLIKSRQRKRTINLLLASLNFSLSSFISSFALKVFLSFWYLEWKSSTTVVLTKYETHQSVMSPFADFVDQVPDYDR